VKVITVAVCATLPAASKAVTVMRLLPVRSWMPAALQFACSVVPLSVARPLPPRSLLQRTLRRYRLSAARPLRPVKPLDVISLCESIRTIGAILSLVLRRPSACTRPSASAASEESSAVVVSSSAPPHAERATQAIASATNIVVLFNRNFIPTSLW